jgi:hypothetical protein
MNEKARRFDIVMTMYNEPVSWGHTAMDVPANPLQWVWDLVCTEPTDAEEAMYTVHFFHKKWANLNVLANQVSPPVAS